jgi:hypothetical protein
MGTSDCRRAEVEVPARRRIQSAQSSATRDRPPFAQEAARSPATAQLLDVEMEKIAGSVAFVADDWRLGWLESRESVEAVAAQNAGESGRGDWQHHADLVIGSTLTAESEDLSFERGVGLAGLVARRRRLVRQTQRKAGCSSACALSFSTSNNPHRPITDAVCPSAITNSMAEPAVYCLEILANHASASAIARQGAWPRNRATSSSLLITSKLGRSDSASGRTHSRADCIGFGTQFIAAEDRLSFPSPTRVRSASGESRASTARAATWCSQHGHRQTVAGRRTNPATHVPLPRQDLHPTKAARIGSRVRSVPRRACKIPPSRR